MAHFGGSLAVYVLSINQKSKHQTQLNGDFQLSRCSAFDRRTYLLLLGKLSPDSRLKEPRALCHSALILVLASAYCGLPLSADAQGLSTSISSSIREGDSTASRPENSENDQVVHVLVNLFAALRDNDSIKLHSIVTQDFYIFDNGVRLDADSALAMISKFKAAGKEFTWNVTEPDVHIHGEFAWIAYVNHGSIKSGSMTQDQKWLESAVLEKQNAVWKLVFAQSTRIPAGVPSAVK